jgi:DNA-directed RNA polymerase specialized sigma24 family protein
MTFDHFSAVYADSELRDYIADMARRLSPTREIAEDASQEAWAAIAQAPDNVSIASLKDSVTTSVASSVWQFHGKSLRNNQRWIRILRDYHLGTDSRKGMI